MHYNEERIFAIELRVGDGATRRGDDRDDDSEQSLRLHP